MKKKLKPLLPSLKERKRYIVFQIESKKDIHKDIAIKTLQDNCLKYLGELGYAKAGIRFLGNRYAKNIGIVKVNHKHVDNVKSAIILTKTIDKQKVIVKNIKVSGTIKAASKREE